MQKWHKTHVSVSGVRNAFQEKPAVLCPLITILASFSVYLLTLVRELGLADSAELALQAHQLGVTHAPGYPVHTILGKLFCFAISEPACATNLLSAVCTSLAVGLLSFMILKMTDDRFAGLCVPLVFAFAPIIWENAVITEVYSVNILIFALSLHFLLSWHRSRSMKLLVAAAIAFGISLGSYLANLFLLPGFLLLILLSPRRRLSLSTMFLVIVGLVETLVLGYNYFRSQVTPPLGTTYLPTSVTGTILYLTGAQYGTTAVYGFRYYAERVMEHAWIFGRNVVGAGIVLGLLGFGCQWHSHRKQCIALLTMVIIDMAYFTTYNSWEYYNMVTPSYFVFAIWIAYGIKFLSTVRRFRAAAVSRAVLVVALAASVFVQLPARLERARAMPVTELVLSSFDALPKAAVVISGWDKFPCLLYFQKIHSLRRDLILIECENVTCHYEHGSVDGYVSYIDKMIGSRPIIIDKISEDIRGKYGVTAIDETWFRLESVEPQL